ncbi:MAG: TIGR04076 family protein [Acidimicrobiia bacterium]|nr:TIGR04076 family protein [Acidimicrobiia bacterium]MDH5294111.1 TIGR04076 family protein [Acidimicrobiia bacterium]
MTDTNFELFDLRVVVDRVEGRSVCGLRVGDFFEVTESSRLRIPEGKHFCIYALGSILPLLAAHQRALAAGDWMAQDVEVCCPDPDERLVMRIERGRPQSYETADLT